MLHTAVAALAIATLAPTFAAAYDDTWYEADFWGGEYPDGFSITKELTVKIRAAPDPDAPAEIDCMLPKGATYHPWNAKRVASDKLTFKSFSLKLVYRINAPYTTTLTDDADSSDVEVTFAVGDTWTELAYLGEGAFLMDYKDTVYVGGQDLLEVSDDADSSASSGLDQWLGLTCANGARGWIWLAEVLNVPGIESPNITDYGKAADLAH